MVELLKQLKEAGYSIMIFTARKVNESDAVEKWLEKHGLSVDNIKYGKPHYHVLIDDRAIEFRDQDTLLNQIEDFKPWWE